MAETVRRPQRGEGQVDFQVTQPFDDSGSKPS